MNIELSDIIRADAQYVSDSGIIVDWSCEYGTVTIGNDVFLQGDEADSLIALASKLYRQSGNVTMMQAMMSVAKTYVECMQ